VKGRRAAFCQAATRRPLAMATPNAAAAMSARVTIHTAALPEKLDGHQGNTKPLAVTRINAEGSAASTFANVIVGGAAAAAALGGGGAGDGTGPGADGGRSEKAWVSRRTAGSGSRSTELGSDATVGATLAFAGLGALKVRADCAGVAVDAGVGVAVETTGDGRGGVGMG
jgi:hypothetical protein